MLDLQLRSTKERLLRPLGAALVGRTSPAVLTGVGFIFCLAAAGLAWSSQPALAVIAWLLGRAFDGLDGVVARADGTASDAGGYADLLLDTVGYAAVPLGIAFGAGDAATWQVVAILVGTFYINAVSWLMLSALLEKRALGAATNTEQTSITMPVGLVEGTETIVFFALALALPSIAREIFIVMAVAVVIGIIQRAVVARQLLGRVPEPIAQATAAHPTKEPR